MHRYIRGCVAKHICVPIPMSLFVFDGIPVFYLQWFLLGKTICVQADLANKFANVTLLCTALAECVRGCRRNS